MSRSGHIETASGETCWCGGVHDFGSGDKKRSTVTYTPETAAEVADRQLLELGTEAEARTYIAFTHPDGVVDDGEVGTDGLTRLEREALAERYWSAASAPIQHP